MSLSIGQTLQGKYVVKKQLGKGGFGLTYLAEHQYLSQNCVLKVPNQELQRDPEYAKFVKKFMQEGQKLAKLAQQRHPHIVRVTDLFEERGLPCLAMDFIAGESLLDRVNRKGALSEVEVVGFILQMADALAVVHREGLVHRDCHPGNIMILPPERHQPQRQAILIDFGIAGELFPTTVSSKFFGNPAFAAYEQFGSKAAPSMDVYTLAASCYFAVTGYLPTTGLDRKLYGKNLISPIKHRSDLTPALNQAIMNGMELEAINRPSLAVWTEQLKQSVAPPPIRHQSAKGIDYSELEKLLKSHEWRKADELTTKLMCQIANREKEGWLDTEHIKAFPCEDLRTMDQLWVHYSNGKFGFSIQKKLWLVCGGDAISKYYYDVWKDFLAKVGWYYPQNNDWRTYTQFMNDTKNAQNALPASLPVGGRYVGDSGGWTLLSRRDL